VLFVAPKEKKPLRREVINTKCQNGGYLLLITFFPFAFFFSPQQQYDENFIFLSFTNLTKTFHFPHLLLAKNAAFTVLVFYYYSDSSK
jgi:hypothetical protein